MELVMANQGALALLHSAQPSNRSRYSIDLTKLFPVTGHHFNVLNGVLLLGAEGLVHADNGDSQQAIGSFMAAGMLADSLAEEPLFIAQIIRDGGWNIIARRLEHALALTQLTEEQLALLQAMVERAEQPRALLRGLAGERAWGIALFADPGMILQDRPPYNTTECLKNDMIIGSSKSTGVFEMDRTFYLNALATSVAASSLPFPGRVNLGQQTPGVAPPFCILSRRILPRISATFTSEANTAARLRAAQVALAVERFRCRHGGKLPATLEELVPDYCKALPADPFTGGPLRFQALDSGFAIYSSRTDPRSGGPLGFRIFR